MKKFGFYTLSVLLLMLVACNTANSDIKPKNEPATPDFNQFLELINQFRSQPQTCMNGTTPENMPAVPPIKLNEQLSTSARLHSEDMAANNYFEHTSLDGRDFSARNTAAGYTGNSLAENIAVGRSTVQETFEQWRKSTSGHCQTYMNANATEVGIGYGFNANSDFVHYWTLVNGRGN